ncbi:MAG TPA: hypothetical protein HPQ00_00025 [Magnetococcales bacterium]|nr:hypothetical protein [Magnetococcales bacterium]
MPSFANSRKPQRFSLGTLSKGRCGFFFRVFFSFVMVFGFSFDGSLATLTVSQAMAADEPVHIGRVFHITGDAQGKRSGEDIKPLQANDEIHTGEEIVTKAGAVAILKFRDGTTFTVGPDGKVVLNEFVFNPTNSETKNTIKVEKGAFRLTSGFKTKNSDVSLRTRTATIGVRGTVAEGFVDEKVPEFINLPKGVGHVQTAGGQVELTEGHFAASQAATNAPVDSSVLPAAIAAQGIGLLRAEIGDELPKGTPLTPEQMKTDALANRMTADQQLTGGKEVAKKGFSLSTLFRSFLRWLVVLLRGWIASLNGWLEHLAGNFSLIREARAAAGEEVSQALSLLVKAAGVGILEPTKGALTPQQTQALQEFKLEAQRVVPDADAVLRSHQDKQNSENRKNTLESTKDVVQGSASVATNSQEVANIVKNAVEASPKGDSEMASVIVREAVSAKGTTNNADAASVITQAAAKADPGVAGAAAGAAVSGLPAQAQAAATGQIAAAAAKAAPEAAASVATAMIQAVGTKAAGEIAAAVTQGAGPASAANVAEAATKAGGPDSAASVAASVTQVAGAASAAKIAEAVMASAGAENAVKVAAAVAQVAGPGAAAQVAVAIAQKLDAGAAAKVAAAVSQVAGSAAADAIVKAVAGSVGAGAEAFKQSVSQAAKSPEIAQAVKESQVVGEQARASGDKARDADAKSDKAATQAAEEGKQPPR